MRLLLAVSIAACVSNAPPIGSAEPTRWIERWRGARACLVAEAEDTRTGVAISMLLGRDCSKELMTLSIEGQQQPSAPLPLHVAATLADELQQTTAPTMRAAVIDSIDAQLVALGVTTERTVAAPLPEAYSVSKEDLQTSKLSTNGGVLRARHKYFDVVINSFEHADGVHLFPHTEYGPPTFPTATYVDSERDTGGIRGALLAAADGARRLVVTREASSAYSYIATDDGVHWTHHSAPAGTRLAGSSQDVDTGDIDLLVRDLDGISLHRLSLRDKRIQVTPWYWLASEAEIVCHDAGISWVLEAESIRELRSDRLGHRRWLLGGWTKNATVDCRGETAVVLRRSPDVLERCGAGCNVVFASKSAIPGVAGLRANGTWLYAAAVENVLAVWEEHHPVAFFRITHPELSGRLRAITDIDGLTLVGENGIIAFPKPEL